MSDRLMLAHAIEDAGIERAKAERMASAIFDAIHDNVATKTDVAAVKTDIAAVEARLAADIAAVRSELALVRSEVALVGHRLLTRLGGLMVVLWAALLAALHYWPPGHG